MTGDLTPARAHRTDVAPATGATPAVRVNHRFERRELGGLIRDAVAVYELTPHEGSRVVGHWVPVNLLDALFAEHGVSTATVDAVLKELESNFVLIRRTMMIDGVQHPVVALRQRPTARDAALVLPPGDRPGIGAGSTVSPTEHGNQNE